MKNGSAGEEGFLPAWYACRPSGVSGMGCGTFDSAASEKALVPIF